MSSQPEKHPAITLWRLLDGKPGHEKQTLGLANALSLLIDCHCYHLNVPSRSASLIDWLLGRFAAGADLPAPDLILAAGHATHLAALAARRAQGGRIIMLMRPSMPLGWFDLCLIPEHDDPQLNSALNSDRAQHVLATRGVLNAVRPSRQLDPHRGLFLIGGHSPHYGWDSSAVIGQISAIIAAQPSMHWQLTDSRRTPPDFIEQLAATLCNRKLSILSHTATPTGWLEQTLAVTGQVWVTQDSVSMVYEALTAGGQVGLLQLPAGQESRVGKGVAKLIMENRLTTFAQWQLTHRLPVPAEQFDEAGRCARDILARWFSNTHAQQPNH